MTQREVLRSSVYFVFNSLWFPGEALFPCEANDFKTINVWTYRIPQAISCS